MERKYITENHYQEILDFMKRNPDYNVERSIEPYSYATYFTSKNEILVIEFNGEMYLSKFN